MFRQYKSEVDLKTLMDSNHFHLNLFSITFVSAILWQVLRNSETYVTSCNSDAKCFKKTPIYGAYHMWSFASFQV